MTTTKHSDGPLVVVVGAGLTGLSAAISAREAGARVVLLEKGGREDVGGNAAFSAGLFLFSYDGPDDLTAIAQDFEPGMQAERIDAPPYKPAAYAAELMGNSEGRADSALVNALAERSLETMRWLVEKGILFTFGRSYGGQVRDDVLHVPPGQVLKTKGEGLSRGFVMFGPLLEHAENIGVEIRWSTALVDLIRKNGRIVGLVTSDHEEIECDAVVIASGGFQADPELRHEHLGPAVAAARLRGTRHSTGIGILAALRVGAAKAGDWASCHSAAVDASMPSPQRSADAPPAPLHGFWLGVLVNQEGERFVDEGPGPWAMNYSKMGKAIVRQPNNVAFEVFDQRTAARVADEFAGLAVPVTAPTIAELAEIIGVPADKLTRTIEVFNQACGSIDHIAEDHGTIGIEPGKSHWAAPLDRPPFVAYRVMSGLTFTFGGVRIDPDGRTLDANGTPLPGLYAAGEATGGLFYGDYPGGAALMRAAVFGRAAGRTAAVEAMTARLSL